MSSSPPGVRIRIVNRTLEERHVDVVSSVLEPAIIDTPGDRSGSTEWDRA
jgi:hypothetical protein